MRKVSANKYNREQFCGVFFVFEVNFKKLQKTA